jgi:hypothetical protein
MSKKLEVACFHCRMERKRQKVKGIYYHTYKESNGMDYDSYTELCRVQTPSGLEILRARALQKLDQHLREAQTRVKNLKLAIKEVRKAKQVGAWA